MPLVDLVSSLFLFLLLWLECSSHCSAPAHGWLFQSALLQLLWWSLHPLSSSSSSSYPLSLLMPLPLHDLYLQINHPNRLYRSFFPFSPSFMVLERTTALWYSWCLGFVGNTGLYYSLMRVTFIHCQCFVAFPLRLEHILPFIDSCTWLMLMGSSYRATLSSASSLPSLHLFHSAYHLLSS